MKKKAPVRLTQRARNDLSAIASYLVAETSERIARRVVKDILAGIEKVRSFSKSGSPRDHIRPGLRALIRHNYVAYYALSRDEIVVIAVVHGSRDVETLFGGENPEE